MRGYRDSLVKRGPGGIKVGAAHTNTNSDVCFLGAGERPSAPKKMRTVKKEVREKSRHYRNDGTLDKTAADRRQDAGGWPRQRAGRRADAGLKEEAQGGSGAGDVVSQTAGAQKGVPGSCKGDRL